MQSEKWGPEESWKEIFSFLVETMETAVKSWHETSKVDPRVYFLLDNEKTQTDKYAPVVNIDKVFKLCQYFFCIYKFACWYSVCYVVQVTYVNSTLNFFFLILSSNKFLTLTCMFSLSIICSLYLLLTHFYWLLLSFACARPLNHPIHIAVVFHFLGSMLMILSPERPVWWLPKVSYLTHR